MAGFGDIVQKALYLGVGLAAYAGEKAGMTFQELRSQAQKLADEMVERGEMTTEEARKFVDDLLKQAQQQQVEETPEKKESKEPRLIEIVTEDEQASSKAPEDISKLREQVQSLQDELRRLKRE
ncbi:MAG: hypothetical protein QNJ54_34760 [Prochloraceae cyanobacterium]|nr:hypothetical protein [Prochloraceae cyanobacterium]